MLVSHSTSQHVKRHPFSIRDLDADGIFVGYASVFGREDLSRDVIEPGAFKTSLLRYGVNGIKMLWNHDPREPIGAWLDIHEDKYGLAVRGRLLTGIKRADEVLVLLRSGTIDGLSIGFRTIKACSGKSGLRRLLEIDLWEISIVTFPMLSGARVAAVKNTRMTEISKQNGFFMPYCTERMKSVTKCLNKDNEAKSGTGY